MVITFTGATGFVGRKLLEKFPPEQNTIIILARRNPGLNSLIQFMFWDAMREEPGTDALDRSEAVVHLAGEPVAQRWTAAAMRNIRESRVTGTRNLVNAMRKARFRPRVLVSASASGIYGDRGDEVLHEASPPGSGFLAEVCQGWEAAAEEASQLGLRVVKLRIGLVLGRGGALAKMVPPFRMGAGGRLGSGKQWMSWIHVEDLVDLIRFAIGNPGVSGVVHAVSPNPVTNAQFTKVLAGVLRRPAIFPVPPAALRLVYGEMSKILLDSARMAPRAATEAGFRFRYPELKPALEDLLA